MNRISPVWILTSLTGEAFDKFKEAINQQFRAFSETELNGFVNCATHRWWGVETIDGGLDGKWSIQTGYPNDIPAYNLQQTQYDSRNHLVVYYAPIEDFTSQSRHVDELNKNATFLGAQRAGTFFYGVTSFHKEKTSDRDFLRLVQNIEDREKQGKLYSSVTFLSDSSHEVGVNPNGYLDLDEGDFLALVVNTIFTIAISKRELHQLNNGQNRLFNTAGVFSFTYEPDALKKSKAYHLSEQLLTDFCNNERDEEWYSQNDAKTHFDGSSLKKNLHWYNIYKLLSQGFEEESIKGLYSQSEISPWRMFAYKLVPFYFKKHLKPLLRKLHDRIHDFSSLTVMRYESFAKNKRKQMLEGSAEIEDKQQFAQTSIADYLCSVWDPNNAGAKGVKQVQLLLKKTKKYLEDQQEEVRRVKSFKEPNDEKHRSFPKMEDYPLHEIHKKENKKYQEYYEKFVTNGEPIAEHTEEADKSYEERLLSKLHRLLQWHAMPLNLFTKAALLSALIFVTVWAFISIIQATNMVRIFSLETNQSLTALFVASAVIVLTFAFVKYGLKTLRKIRLIIQKYIAWSYYRVQREVYGISLHEAEEYYMELLRECDRIDNQLKAFVVSKIQNKPSFERYKMSKFQRNIIGNMDDGSPILANTALNISLRVNNIEFSPDEVVLGLFTAMLKEGNQNLKEQMRDSVLLEIDQNEKVNMKENLLELWSDLLTGKIDVLINGQYGNTVDFPAFHGTNTSNFTIQAIQSVNAIIYPSVYVYAMNPYSRATSIVPGLHGVRWEEMFYGPNHVNEKVPDYVQVQNQHRLLVTQQIAVFMRIHAYDRLIVNKDEDTKTTIFNNQL